MRESNVLIHDEAGFQGMRKAGALAADVLDMITGHVKKGTTTQMLDDICHEYIIKQGAIPAPLNYKGFPKSTCISLNHVVCHGIPGDRKLLSGDILNIDVTVILDGWYGDTSRMYYVDTPPIKSQRLTEVTYDCLMFGIEAAKPGNRLGDIGYAIQTCAEKNRFSVVRDFTGHGLGKVFHCAPSVLHFGNPGTGMLLEPGMIFTIEPMINQGSKYTKLLSDGWTVETKDGRNSAQWEHTLAVTASGVEVLTKRSEESF